MRIARTIDTASEMTDQLFSEGVTLDTAKSMGNAFNAGILSHIEKSELNKTLARERERESC